jgi:hypothetical protein
MRPIRSECVLPSKGVRSAAEDLATPSRVDEYHRDYVASLETKIGDVRVVLNLFSKDRGRSQFRVRFASEKDRERPHVTPGPYPRDEDRHRSVNLRGTK